MSKASHRRNVGTQIQAPVVLVIDQTGVNLGETPLSEALALADNLDVDLVEMGKSGKIPVCRLVNAGKLAYEEQKAAKANRRANVTKVHEIKLRVATADGDLATKLRQIDKFLDRGDKVLVTIMLKGRQIQREHDADRVLGKLQDHYNQNEHVKVDGPVKTGRDIKLTLARR